jgi:hypothetical protein
MKKGWSARRFRASSLALLLLACAAPAPAPVPRNLPLASHDQRFEFRYAIERADRSVSATGTVRHTGTGAFQAVLALYGLDGAGTIVSRGQTVVDWGFDGTAPRPFRIELRSTGRESQYVLRVLQASIADERTR